MIENRDWVFADLGVSTDQAIEAFKALGGSFANCKINEDSLQELKIPSSVICPDNAKSSIEFFPTHDIITQLEARIAKLEKLVDELRTNAIEKTENPNQKTDLEIFESNMPKEDENISILNDILQKPFKIDWDEIKFF